MQEFEAVTSETSVDPRELNELIARLSNPHRGNAHGAVKIKDIAETMDLNDEEVIDELVQLRKRRKAQPVPQEAEKLANVLNELKTTNFKPLTNRPLKRISATLVVLIIGLVFGIYMIAMNYLSHQPSGKQPVSISHPTLEKGN